MSRDVLTVRLVNGRVVTLDGPVARREIAAGRAMPVTERETAMLAPPETAARPRGRARRHGG